MREWALELQFFFTSWGSDTKALARSIDACDDIEIKDCLRKLHQIDEKTINQGVFIYDRVVKQGYKSEAAILRLVIYIRLIELARNPLQIPTEKRHKYYELLKEFENDCRNDPELLPSLAMISMLKGVFKYSIRDFATARAANEEARDIYATLAKADPQTYQSDLAATLNNLGLLYRDTRDFAAARAANEEARDIYAILATADPQTYQSDLAATLNNLGSLYRVTRDFATALAAYEEALDIRRTLATADPQTYQSDLAATLNNLGSLYRVTRDFATALAAYEEALDIRRTLATADPQTYQSDLAATLNSLGLLYSDTREFAAARAAYEEARDIYATLATADPQTYQSDLAATLNNFGNLYSDTRDFAAARAAYEKALDIRRTLAKADPQTYLSDLAMTLNNLGNLYSDTRDFAGARAAYEEALDIRRTLATADPQTYLSDLAMTLNNLGLLYSDTRDFAAAHAAYEEARDIYATLAKTDPQTYHSYLATTLNNFGNLYSDTRNFAAAHAAYEEARDIYVTLATADPQTYLSDLATTLNNLGLLYSDTRDFAVAHAAYEEARDIYATLAKTDPQTYQSYLAATLNNLGNLYRDTRDFAAARAAYEEVRDIYVTLAKADPQTYQSDLAMMLNNLGNLYSDTRDFATARPAYEEALDIRRTLAKADPQTYLSYLATTLNNLGLLYNDTRDFAAARPAYEEALDIRRTLAKADPQTYLSYLATTLNNLGNLYSDTRDFAGARAAYEEALDIRRTLAKADPQTYLSYLATTLNNLGNLYSDTRDFATARAACEEAILSAESERIGAGTPLHLNKGNVTQAYRFLLQDACPDVLRTFALLAALRNGATRSSTVKVTDLAATQLALAEIERASKNPCALLMPNTGADEEKMILGLITAHRCLWFIVPTDGWGALLRGNNDGVSPIELRALARNIWKQLPDVIQSALSPEGPGSHEILISGDSFWSSFPWELLRFADGDSDYLGLHKALPRIGSVLASDIERQLAGQVLGCNDGRVTVIAPHTTGKVPLDGVEREFAALKKFVPAAGGVLVNSESGEAAHDRLMNDAIKAQPSILYFSGHGTIMQNEELLVLHRDPRPDNPRENKTYFGAYHLKGIAKELGKDRVFENAPLIVMNSCMTGRTHDHGGFREDLVSAFLDEGAGTVIASALPIYDSVGEAFGCALFSGTALAQPTVGGLVVEARRQLAFGECSDISSPKWGAWGMMHIHGNAEARPPLPKLSEGSNARR